MKYDDLVGKEWQTRFKYGKTAMNQLVAETEEWGTTADLGEPEYPPPGWKDEPAAPL